MIYGKFLLDRAKKKLQCSFSSIQSVVVFGVSRAFGSIDENEKKKKPFSCEKKTRFFELKTRKKKKKQEVKTS